MSVDTQRVMILKTSLEDYLSSVFRKDVEVASVDELGKPKEELKASGRDKLKGFGYGIPYLIVLDVDGYTKKVVLETMRTSGGFGHDFFSDRAGILLWQNYAFNKLPKHVRSVDVGAFTKSQRLKSLGDCEELFTITEFVEGELYHKDLDRLKTGQQLTPLDLKRCQALSDYLVDIHKVKTDRQQLYLRRVRDLVGHGECIMGLLDSYPSHLNYVTEQDLMEVEKRCVEWRWRLKRFKHRVAQVHGDYHPWNILFQKEDEFIVLDRSRGEWGEPADDVSALTINYLFYSLQKYGRLENTFRTLFRCFWKNYLDKTGDDEILQVVQPFLVWRGLVVASPVWYPNLPDHVRTKLFNFIGNVLDTETLDWENINSYF